MTVDATTAGAAAVGVRNGKPAECGPATVRVESLRGLIDAQLSGDRFREAAAIQRAIPTGRTRGNDRDGRSPAWRFYSKVAYGVSDCWVWVGAKHKLGYGLTGKGKAHRVSWEMHCGPIPEGMSVLHRCDVRCCVNPDHLFLGTQADNVHDMMSKGRGSTKGPRGERNGGSKLTDAVVVEMRRMRDATGLSYKAIAKHFGTTTMTAHRAITGRSWKHINGEAK